MHWSRDGKEIRPSPCIKMNSVKDTHLLEIPQVCPEDEGVYEITASNDMGRVTCSAKLSFGSELCFAISVNALQAEPLHADIFFTQPLNL